jgi:hypothetical protein
MGEDIRDLGVNPHELHRTVYFESLLEGIRNPRYEIL